VSVDDLFGAAPEPAPVRAEDALRGVRRWSWLAGALNYAGFLGGLGVVFLQRAIANGDGALELVGQVLGVLLVVAMVMSLLAVPGALVTAWAWIRADETLRQARTGALPSAVGDPAFRARERAFVLIIVACVCLFVQLVALQSVLGGRE